MVKKEIVETEVNLYKLCVILKSRNPISISKNTSHTHTLTYILINTYMMNIFYKIKNIENCLLITEKF